MVLLILGCVTSPTPTPVGDVLPTFPGTPEPVVPFHSQADALFQQMFFFERQIGVFTTGQDAGGGVTFFSAETLARGPTHGHRDIYGDTPVEVGQFDAAAGSDILIDVGGLLFDSDLFVGGDDLVPFQDGSGRGLALVGSHCGDVTGDGVDDRCGVAGLDVGPPDGVIDVGFELAATGSFTAVRAVVAELQMGQRDVVIADGPNGRWLRVQLQGEQPIDPGDAPRILTEADMQSVEMSSSGPPQVVDIDDDGDDEVALNGAVVGREQFEVSAPEQLLGRSDAWLGDFDGDGAIEQAFLYEDGEEHFLGIASLDGVGLKAFELDPASNYTPGRAPSIEGVGDADHSGADDLLIAQSDGVDVHVWLLDDAL